MTWKFNKDNWTYIAEDNIEEFLNGSSKDVPNEVNETSQEAKPKTKRSKKSKQIL